jgi:hypothetical protein
MATPTRYNTLELPRIEASLDNAISNLLRMGDELAARDKQRKLQAAKS